LTKGPPGGAQRPTQLLVSRKVRPLFHAQTVAHPLLERGHKAVVDADCLYWCHPDRWVGGSLQSYMGSVAVAGDYCGCQRFRSRPSNPIPHKARRPLLAAPRQSRPFAHCRMSQYNNEQIIQIALLLSRRTPRYPNRLCLCNLGLDAPLNPNIINTGCLKLALCFASPLCPLVTAASPLRNSKLSASEYPRRCPHSSCKRLLGANWPQAPVQTIT
jgi:hypothetical protein